MSTARWLRHGSLAVALWVLAGCASLSPAPPPADDITMALDAALARAVDAGEVPGAVLLVTEHGRVRYQRTVGLRTREPATPLTPDTVFDLASLTKVLCTAPAVMQLAARGRLDLDAPVARYWPAFGNNGKQAILVRHLLTHYSGLVSDITLGPTWRDMAGARRLIEAMPPLAPPDTIFVYSDVNYAVLGELVRQASGEPLDDYCARHLFQPARMRDTAYGGARAAERRGLPIAPTSADPNRLGKVHDPTASRMGGIVGHAGLFGTAKDVARFVNLLLDGGRARGQRVLRRADVDEMTRNHAPQGAVRQRGFGWDLAGDDRSNALVPFGTYGHTGFTGTSIWVDPARKIGVILLTHRVYPDNGGQVAPLRAAIAAIMRRW
jgi:CubicO group peptidase (beta-lactamase class C family)